MEEKFKARINYKGDIKDISEEICKDYGFGEFKSNETVLIGYEDYNYILVTSKGKYFVKIFSNIRSVDDCKRYVDIMKAAMENKIATPKLYKSSTGYLYIKKINNVIIRLCVMECITGKTFFELNEKLNKEEIKFLAHQTALINSIKINPRPIYDWWAITNFQREFNDKSKSLNSDDLKLIEPLVQKFKNLDIKKLPYCFVHGDIIGTNVIKDKENRLWIIDFSVSNYYPRIQELAVLSCLFVRKNKINTENNIKIALDEYQKFIKLTPEELKALPTYIELAHAMHVLCAGYEKNVRNNSSKENEYFLEEGRIGLKQMQA